MDERRALAAAYRRTRYLVELPPARTARILLDGPNTWMIDWLHDAAATPWTYLTAWNPLGRPDAPDTNRARNTRLVAQLHEAGYRCYPGRGQPPPGEAWEAEESYWILGMSETAGADWAVRYGQLAYLTGSGISSAALRWTGLRAAGS